MTTSNDPKATPVVGGGAGSSGSLDARIDVDGVGIRFRVEGDGAPVVMLHGFTGNVEAMAEVADVLVAAHRLIGIDLVGHGQSDSPTNPDHYRMSAVIGQVQAVLDHLRIEQAHFFGYSMGARTALSFGCEHPHRVRSLSLVGVHPGLDDHATALERRHADDELAQSILDQPIEHFVDRWMSNPLFATQARLGAAYLAASRRSRLLNNPHGLAGSLRGMGTGSMKPLGSSVGAIAAPVALIVGELDEKFCRIADQLAPSFANARAHVVSGVGHATHVEAPEATADIVRATVAQAEDE